jgi:hypothetical protein
MNDTPRPEDPAAPRPPSDVENVPGQPGVEDEAEADRIDEVSDGEPT